MVTKIRTKELMRQIRMNKIDKTFKDKRNNDKKKWIKF